MAKPVQKILGQSNPSATTNTDVYTVPTNSSATISSIAVCNTSTADTFRVAVRRRGETLATRHYIYYEKSIAQNDSVFIIVGMTLSAGDVITVYAGTANLAFSLFGVEVMP